MDHDWFSADILKKKICSVELYGENIFTIARFFQKIATDKWQKILNPELSCRTQLWEIDFFPTEGISNFD